MAKSRKTDNHNLAAKLALRRHFLRKYHSGDDGGIPAVLDCCQGGGKLWAALCSEFNVRYWGLDLKPKKGRLKLDSRRYLAQAGWPEEIIDIDTYGSPWKHWAAMLPNVTRPLTVFLTIGATMFRGSVEGIALAAMGLNFRRLELPATFCGKLSSVSIPYCLALADRHGLEITEAVEASNNGGAARYLGLRIAPKIAA